jgi:hypothetical protein
MNLLDSRSIRRFAIETGKKAKINKSQYSTFKYKMKAAIDPHNQFC